MTLPDRSTDYSLSVYDFYPLEQALHNLHAEEFANLCALPCRIIGVSNNAICTSRQQLLTRISTVFDAYKGLNFTRIKMAAVEFEHLACDLLVAYGTFVLSLNSGADISALSTLTLKKMTNRWKLVSIEVLDVSIPTAE